jgi:hypothetical protein
LKHEKENTEIHVFGYELLSEIISTLPTNILDLTISDLNPDEKFNDIFPSLAHLTNLYTLTLTGFTELKNVPVLSPNHNSGDSYLKLILNNCYNIDVSSLCPHLFELTITNHSFIDRIHLPINARRIIISNTSIGVIIPPADSSTYNPFRGYLILQNSPCANYPKIDKLIRPEYYNISVFENTSSDYEMEELEIAMISNPAIPYKLRMYEAYQLIEAENRYVLKQIFPQLQTNSFNHLHDVTLHPTETTDISNLQEKYPIDRASTLGSNPIRRALEFIV